MQKIIDEQMEDMGEDVAPQEGYDADIDLEDILGSLFSAEEWIEVIRVIKRFIEMRGREDGLLFTGNDKKQHTKNYARVQFLVLLLCQAILRADPQRQQEQTRAHQGSWIWVMVMDYLREGVIRLGVEPLSNVIRYGSALTLVERLHHTTQRPREGVSITDRLDLGHAQTSY
jgi:hypothetical protein